jgi:hypothetical protein
LTISELKIRKNKKLDMVARLLSRKNLGSTIGSRSNAGSELGSPLASDINETLGNQAGLTSPQRETPNSVEIKALGNFAPPKISPRLEMEQGLPLADGADDKKTMSQDIQQDKRDNLDNVSDVGSRTSKSPKKKELNPR